MRALCGAIITAGAVIGLGLTALGIGTRYTRERVTVDDGNPPLVHLSQMDRPLVFVLVFLTCVAVIGLGIAFLGLAYHHARREREHQWEKEKAAQHRTTV
jgi:multisubunit Na+/H+ antiporter MnhC subunit